MMMNVGVAKGTLVDALIREKKPSIMVELGGYAGYSAVRFASLQREVAGTDAHYFSFESSPELAECVRTMVAFAGLSDQVTVITGAFADQIDAICGKAVDVRTLVALLGKLDSN
jgi:catechol O-methyltransferase